MGIANDSLLLVHSDSVKWQDAPNFNCLGACFTDFFDGFFFLGLVIVLQGFYDSFILPIIKLLLTH